MKTRVESMPFFIDKECGTGYGRLSESLFTFCMEFNRPASKAPPVLRVENNGAGRTVYLLETYLNYLSKGGIDNAEA